MTNRIDTRLALALAAAAAAMSAPATGQNAPAAAPSVEVGFNAWQAGNYDEAVRNWRPRADRGDADAQFNLGHAYRLGRGVPQNMNLAEQWYERAARAGHQEAQAMYGVILFQNGRRAEAMPYIRRGAEQGDPRAQYVYGTALFNGDLVPRDLPRAWAMMTRSAAQGLAPAQSQLREMEQHLSAEDRARGDEIAAALVQSAPAASARVDAPAPPPVRVATTEVPPSTTPTPQPRPSAPPPPAPAATRPTPRPTTPAPAAGGRWRIQLGAFSSEANARSAWNAVRSRLPGLEPYYVRAGTVFRLQAGPLASRAAAAQACAAARQACFPVAP
ncbi:SPOR domain-containing protein [Sphingosinicella sp. LHD-64]|uniref:SPOR domain-containing protein n=1 Tax=Sphingosinicella sp. LHD-64 TaxID=3072139 RepID=UPI00280EE3C2|nr:SPOR domain-containing protein [Sphingosinicella sp. LHD-64]MDQ8755273.1 SPOR domain-containing protein [Sphingosinicella sp. LHD-64]